MTLLGHVCGLWAFSVFSSIGVGAVRQNDLYDFGGNVGDRALPQGDDVFAEVTLETPINIFGETYNKLYVSTNGLVSFLTPLETFINVQFPLNIPVIAPFYANADTTRRGHVYYRESNRQQDLLSSLNTLRRLFPNLSSDFQPISVFIVTWEGVGAYFDDPYEETNKGNTFQLAITTDGETSFVEFLYHNDGIQWIQAGNREDTSEPYVRAQAGIVSPSGKLFTLKGSGSDQVIHVDRWTNGDTQGQYVYKIGNDDDDGSTIVEQPQLTVLDYGELQAKSCAEVFVGCHSDAECNDTPSGVCCTCRPLYIGNGLSCLKKDMPLRLNGPLSINLNGIRLENLVFEGYIVLKDGRVYTAVDTLPSTLGPAMQFLKPLESIPGWLFAVTPEETLKNGFQLTGAVLNHTATLSFSPQQVVRIRQIYKGPDAYDHVKVEVDISGRIPEFPLNFTLKHPEYEEVFTKTAPGEYRSTSIHKYQLNNGEMREINVEQTINFRENCHSESESAPQRMVSNRNYMSYKEPILRLAGFHRLGGGPVFEDPCIKGKAQCVANSSCLVSESSFRCVCNSGFRSEYYDTTNQPGGCVDINECQDRTADCHENAICLNEIGSYSCHCNSGYSGDGTHCELTVDNRTPATDYEGPRGPSGESLDCSEGFEIQYDYASDTTICVDIDECSRLAQVCSQDASCVNFEGGFECRCLRGFTGDGRQCVPVGCEAIACPVGSECDDRNGSPQCVCPPGYVGYPPSCQLPSGQEPEPDDHCTTDSDCPQNARCSASLSFGHHSCACFDGSPVSPSGRCEGQDPPADPALDKLFKTCYQGRCWCPPGFEDDGQHCVKIGSRPDQEQDSWPEPEPLPPTEPPIVHREDPSSCHIAKNCHENAMCIAAMSVDDGYRCMCNPGFEGDGYNCSESDLSCDETDICHKNAVCMPDSEESSKYVCICSQGYAGDGYICYPAGQCNQDSDCGESGVCEYNEEKESHECNCKRGYTRDAGGNCVPERGPEPEPCTACDPNSSCVLKGGYNICQCNDGYQGDGLTCTEIIQGCDTLNNCDRNAQCLYTPSEDGYRCTCNEGYEGDGLQCNQILTCYQDPSFCHENARCVYLSSTYTCKCDEGFFGNGTFCKEAANQKEEFLLLTKGGSVLRVPFSPTIDDPGIPINIQGWQVAVGITTDCVEGKVYWSDISGSIKRSKYDGSEYEEFLVTKGESPEGLALDWINRQIYWTDTNTDKISSANLDTKEVKVIIDKGLRNPRGIAVHPFRRKLYWSDWNRNDPKIEESDLDGSRRRIVVNRENIKLPNALTIDWDRDELCWSNAGAKTIDCMYLNARMPTTVVSKAPYPFGLAVTNDRYYWSDWQTMKIMSAPKDGKTEPQLSTISVPLGGDDKMFGLTAVRPCPR